MRQLIVVSLVPVLISACSSPADRCNATSCAPGFDCQQGACVPSPGTGGGTATGGGTGAGGGTATGGGSGAVMAGSFTVSGVVTYDFVPIRYDAANDTGTLDFAAASQRPVRHAVVKVLEGTTVLATGETANDGQYSLGFTSTGAGPLVVQVQAKANRPAIQVQDNTASGAVWAFNTPVPAGGGALDLRATHGWLGARYGGARRAGPFAILDSMTIAVEAFLAVRPALVFPALKVNWSPNNTTATNGTLEQGFLGTSFYDPDSNQIYVVGKDGEDTDEYDNHVIVHEWGHFFEANLSRSDSLGGDHTAGDVLDPRDSFSEGWGNAASGILLNDRYYADSYWSRSGIDAFGFDLETAPAQTDDPTPGPFSESSVMRFIYDLGDGTNEAGDTLSGLGPIADAFVALKNTDALCTLGSFVTGLKGAGGANAASVDAMLARISVGAITSDYGDGDADLRGMYTDVATLPLAASVSLNGRLGYNMMEQNKYWVFTGTGRPLTVTASSAQDVGLTVYRRGAWALVADDLSTGGTERGTFNSTAGATYILNLTGYGANNAAYSASVSITSP